MYEDFIKRGVFHFAQKQTITCRNSSKNRCKYVWIQKIFNLVLVYVKIELRGKQNIYSGFGRFYI